MFRALLCSSSGGSIVYVQHLVPSQSVSGRTIEPPEDEPNNARNM